MMKKFFLVFVVVACSLYGITRMAFSQKSSGEVQKPATNYEQVLWSFVAADKTVSKIISPYSLWQMSALLYRGAGGTTKSALAPMCAWSHPSLESGADTSLNICLQEGLRLLPEFIAKVEGEWPHVAVTRVPFGKDINKSVQEINQAVARTTGGRFRDVLASKDIDRDTVLALIATLYFQAEWESPFDPEQNHKDVFYEYANKKTPCTMMQQQLLTRYYSDGSAQYIALPFSKKKIGQNELQFALEIVLPQGASDSATAQIDCEAFLQIARKEAKNTWIDLALPKMAFHGNIDLHKLYESYGAEIIFQEAADFGGMSPAPLMVQKVFQNLRFALYEKGCELEAATIATLRMKGMYQSIPVVTVRVNRPFYVILKEESQELPLLIGYIGHVE